jgi:hypothetical protein
MAFQIYAGLGGKFLQEISDHFERRINLPGKDIQSIYLERGNSESSIDTLEQAADIVRHLGQPEPWQRCQISNVVPAWTQVSPVQEKALLGRFWRWHARGFTTLGSAPIALALPQLLLPVSTYCNHDS